VTGILKENYVCLSQAKHRHVQPVVVKTPANLLVKLPLVGSVVRQRRQFLRNRLAAPSLEQAAVKQAGCLQKI